MISHAYRMAAQAGQQEVLLSLWRTPRGRYLYSNIFPTPALFDYFGTVAFWDGTDQTLGDGQKWGGG